jgi:hypothetical protein
VRLPLGPLLVVAALASYVALLFAGWLPRALWLVPWPFLVAAGAGVALALRSALRTRRRSAWVGLTVAVILVLAFGFGLPVATRLPPVDGGALAQGAQAPDFTLPSTDGHDLTLSSLRGRTVALVFHRGHW